jgi:hypothetical protein
VALLFIAAVIVCDAQFQVKLPKLCPNPEGAVLVIPVIKHVEFASHVAVGIIPPFRAW